MPYSAAIVKCLEILADPSAANKQKIEQYLDDFIQKQNNVSFRRHTNPPPPPPRMDADSTVYSPGMVRNLDGSISYPQPTYDPTDRKY